MKSTSQKGEGEGIFCYQQTFRRHSCCNDSLICHRKMVTLLWDNGEDELWLETLAAISHDPLEHQAEGR